MLILWYGSVMGAASGGGSTGRTSGLKATLVRHLGRRPWGQRRVGACCRGRLAQAEGFRLGVEAPCLAVGCLAAGLVLAGCAEAWPADGAGVARGDGSSRWDTCRDEAAVPLWRQG